MEKRRRKRKKANDNRGSIGQKESSEAETKLESEMRVAGSAVAGFIPARTEDALAKSR